jgi:C-terminal processing protease CtpA/Prc
MKEEVDNIIERYENGSSLRLISLEVGQNGLGIRLSKSSWDPYPFVSNVDEDSTANKHGLQVGDCILKVLNGKFHLRSCLLLSIV